MKITLFLSHLSLFSCPPLLPNPRWTRHIYALRRDQHLRRWQSREICFACSWIAKNSVADEGRFFFQCNFGPFEIHSRKADGRFVLFVKENRLIGSKPRLGVLRTYTVKTNGGKCHSSNYVEMDSLDTNPQNCDIWPLFWTRLQVTTNHYVFLLGLAH